AGFGRGVELDRLAPHREALVGLTLRARGPGRRGTSLDLDLLSPVRVLHRFLERGEPIDVGARTRGVAASSGADGAREVDHRLRVRESVGTRLDGRRLRPLPALDRPSRLDRGNREVLRGPAGAVLA